MGKHSERRERQCSNYQPAVPTKPPSLLPALDMIYVFAGSQILKPDAIIGLDSSGADIIVVVGDLTADGANSALPLKYYGMGAIQTARQTYGCYRLCDSVLYTGDPARFYVSNIAGENRLFMDNEWLAVSHVHGHRYTSDEMALATERATQLQMMLAWKPLVIVADVNREARDTRVHNRLRTREEREVFDVFHVSLAGAIEADYDVIATPAPEHQRDAILDSIYVRKGAFGHINFEGFPLGIQKLPSLRLSLLL